MAAGQFTLPNGHVVRYDTATGAAVDTTTGQQLAATPATASGGTVGANGLPLGQLRTAEGSSTYLIGPDGQAVVVAPGEVQSLLQQPGYSMPNADQQAWTQNAFASRNGGYYPTNEAAGSSSAAAGAAGGAQVAAPTTVDYRAQTRALFPYIPADLVDVFAGAWAQYGDPNLAMGALRQDPRYDQFFPGNRRADGTVRASEGEYLSTMEGYDRQLASFGLNGADFQAQKVRAFTNDRSPVELGNDLASVYVGVVTQGDAIRKYYADSIGATGLSDAALLGSAITFHDDKVSPVEFQRKITMAQIGGTAAEHGFNIAQQEAGQLASFGLDEAAARKLYTGAQAQLPTLGDLQQQFNDPNSPLTVEDYTNAIVLNDPAQLAHLGRLYGQASAQFSAGHLIATDQAGGQQGLVAR